MEFYGDESGHLRSLLEGDEDLFVLAVAAGDPECCMRCPKRAVRNVSNIEEAKWSDLTDTQRRRMIDCLAKCEPDLSFGYVAIELEDLHRLKNHHRLYQDDLRYDWDLCVIGDCYAELVRDLAGDRNGYSFIFDRMISKRKSNKVVEVIEETTRGLNVSYDNSRKTDGIQTADCFAGAVREDRLRKQNWLDEFEEVNDSTESALATVEERLFGAKTDP